MRTVEDKIFNEQANCETTYFVRPESDFCQVEPDKTLATIGGINEKEKRPGYRKGIHC